MNLTEKPLTQDELRDFWIDYAVEGLQFKTFLRRVRRQVMDPMEAATRPFTTKVKERPKPNLTAIERLAICEAWTKEN